MSASRLERIALLKARGHRLVAEDDELLWEDRRADDRERERRKADAEAMAAEREA